MVEVVIVAVVVFVAEVVVFVVALLMLLLAQSLTEKCMPYDRGQSGKKLFLTRPSEN